MELSRLCPHTQRPLPVNFRRRRDCTSVPLLLSPSTATYSRTRLLEPLHFAVAQGSSALLPCRLLTFAPSALRLRLRGIGFKSRAPCHFDRIRSPTPASRPPGCCLQEPAGSLFFTRRFCAPVFDYLCPLTPFPNFAQPALGQEPQQQHPSRDPTRSDPTTPPW